MEPDDIRQLVDEVVAAQKRMIGHSDFTPFDTNQDEYRWAKQLQHADLECGRLQVIYHPRNGDPVYTIHILYRDRSIWRLDWTNQPHTNLGKRPPDMDPFISTPHYHAWHDNRHLAARGKLPSSMNLARPLDDSIRNFDQAFKWFCNQTHITFENSDIPLTPLGGLGL